MRKLGYIIGVFVCSMALTSCQNEIENWYSETFDYAGRFVVATACDEYDSDNTAIEDGLEVMIYNTAANTSDEIWVEFSIAGFHQKGKFKLKGNSADAAGVETVENNISTDTYYIDTDYGLAPFDPSYAAYFRVPSAADELNDGVNLYTRITLDTLKIIPQAATTIGGNTSDSIYVKFTLHHDYMLFVSQAIPEEDWEDPAVPEYEWVIKPGSNSPADPADWDEHWAVSGYRYTGFPEDL
ncbi:hypothetical protein FACS1894123_12030 [Bacteroidia bacterium]|nr:hypothetical protein FACS1894123_12030 [Bacteroidia bacterium]